VGEVLVTALPSTRYDRLVEALGGRGVLVREPKEIGPVVLDPSAYRRTGQVSMAI
jgi:hypothetical protein